MNTPQVDVEKFWRDGFLLIKRAFSPDEIESLREDALAILAEQKAAGLTTTSGSVTHTKGDLLSMERLRKVIVDDRILRVGRELLGNKPVYFGDSSFQVGEGLRGWHKDNRLPDRFNHSAEDWHGKYTVIRFGLYLQDHASHSGGLGIRVGSHQPSRLVKLLERVPPARLRAQVASSYGKAVLVDSEIGDLVAWNLRTTHSGNAVRLKSMSRTKLGTWFENIAPSWLRIEEEKQRVAMFFTFGVDGDHLERYLGYLKTRGYLNETWDNLRQNEAAFGESKNADLEIRIPS